MNALSDVQDELARVGIDGWLVYDFRGSNPVARPILDPLLEGNIASRRVFLMIPAAGEPTLLVHAIEYGTLRSDLSSAMGVTARRYSSTESLDHELRALLAGKSKVAMEYSPAGDNPYVGTVDAGTIERVRGLGVEVVSSGEIAQVLELWTEEQLDQHLTAAEAVMAAKDEALAYLVERRAVGAEVRETDVQRVISDSFDRGGFSYDHAATVGFAAHAGDPHYSPIPGVRDAALAAGDVVLLDLWCKVPEPRAPYADITWMAVVGEPDPAVESAFAAVSAARDAAFMAVAQAYEQHRWPTGAEVDAAARNVLVEAGFAEAFTHRTGHSLGVKSAHGLAAHLDGFETKDMRLLRPGLGFTIEPGVYLPGFGVRSEINVYIDAQGPRATTDLQAGLEVIP